MKTLKRIALVVAALLIFAGSANAKILSFGVKAGLNVNKLHFNESVFNDLGNSTGWEAGIMAEANIPIIGLGVDLSLMYARMNNEVGSDVGKNFLMIPLNLKYKFNLPVVSHYLVPYIFTGPDFLFKLDKNVMNSIKTKTCQVAWQVGLGVELIQHLQIGASYGFGINNIADKWVNATDLNVKNNYWTVTAAWLF